MHVRRGRKSRYWLKLGNDDFVVLPRVVAADVTVELTVGTDWSEAGKTVVLVYRERASDVSAVFEDGYMVSCVWRRWGLMGSCVSSVVRPPSRMKFFKS